MSVRPTPPVRRPQAERDRPTDKEQWLRTIEAKLNTDDERTYLRRCVAKMDGRSFEQLAQLSPEDAATELRREMGGPGPLALELTTRKEPSA